MRKGGYSQPPASPSSFSPTVKIVVGKKGTGLPKKKKRKGGGCIGEAGRKINYLVFRFFVFFPLSVPRRSEKIL